MTDTQRTCARCKRPVGHLRPSIVRSWKTEITEDGVSTVCYNEQSCKFNRKETNG